jgi:hypothetical protein
MSSNTYVTYDVDDLKETKIGIIREWTDVLPPNEEEMPIWVLGKAVTGENFPSPEKLWRHVEEIYDYALGTHGRIVKKDILVPKNVPKKAVKIISLESFTQHRDGPSHLRLKVPSPQSHGYIRIAGDYSVKTELHRGQTMLNLAWLKPKISLSANKTKRFVEALDALQKMKGMSSHLFTDVVNPDAHLRPRIADEWSCIARNRLAARTQYQIEHTWSDMRSKDPKGHRMKGFLTNRRKFEWNPSSFDYDQASGQASINSKIDDLPLKVDSAISSTISSALTNISTQCSMNWEFQETKTIKWMKRSKLKEPNSFKL